MTDIITNNMGTIIGALVQIVILGGMIWHNINKTNTNLEVTNKIQNNELKHIKMDTENIKEEVKCLEDRIESVQNIQNEQGQALAAHDAHIENLKDKKT